MSLENNPVSGALYLLKGVQAIRRPGVRRFVAVPLAVNIALFAGLTILLFNQMGVWMEQLIAQLPEWLQWIDWLIWLLLGASVIVFTYFTFTLVANIISSPFNGLLSEAIERQAGHAPLEQSASLASVVKEIGPSLREEMRKLFYAVTRSVPFLILLFIPGINFFASVAWLIFSAWMLALQYADYPFANHRIFFNQQRGILKQKRWLVLGFGGAVLAGTMIPVVNFFVLPSAVAGATLLYLDHFKDKDGDTPVRN